MIISHKHKFIFFKTGKAASTTIGKILESYGDVESERQSEFFNLNKRERYLYQGHIPPFFAKYWMKNKVFDEYFKFAFVRNPWDLLISRYFYSKFAKQKRGLIAKFCKIREKDLIFLIKNNRIKEMIDKGIILNRYQRLRGMDWLEYRTQTNFLSDKKGKILVDFVGKYENIQADLNYISNRLKLGQMKVPHLNKSSHFSYKFYYCERTKNIVNDYFREDIENFGYTF